MARPVVVGFTGLRAGMSSSCVAEVSRQLDQLVKDAKHAKHAIVGLHGDCVGGDADFDCLCRLHGITTWSRPCTMGGEVDHVFRAYTPSKQVGTATKPMARNREIASQCDVLFGCPPTNEELKRGSGSWATIRYAKQYGKPTCLFFPDGSTELDDLSWLLGA